MTRLIEQVFGKGQDIPPAIVRVADLPHCWLWATDGAYVPRYGPRGFSTRAAAVDYFRHAYAESALNVTLLRTHGSVRQGGDTVWYVNEYCPPHIMRGGR